MVKYVELFRNVDLEVNAFLVYQRKVFDLPKPIDVPNVEKVLYVEAVGEISYDNWYGGDLDVYITILGYKEDMFKWYIIPGLSGFRVPIDWGKGFGKVENQPFHVKKDLNVDVSPMDKIRIVSKLGPIPIPGLTEGTLIELTASTGWVKAHFDYVRLYYTEKTFVPPPPTPPTPNVPKAKIINVYYPQEVEPSKAFEIVVQVKNEGASGNIFVKAGSVTNSAWLSSGATKGIKLKLIAPTKEGSYQYTIEAGH